MNNKYDDLVKKLKDYAGFNPETDYFNMFDVIADCADAADAIESLSAQLEKKENGGWIKCSERMPDTVKVWGCVKFSDEKGNTFHQEEIVFYDGDGNFTNCGNFPVPVVAWQPLPEPYKECGE